MAETVEQTEARVLYHAASDIQQLAEQYPIEINSYGGDGDGRYHFSIKMAPDTPPEIVNKYTADLTAIMRSSGVDIDPGAIKTALAADGNFGAPTIEEASHRYIEFPAGNPDNLASADKAFGNVLSGGYGSELSEEMVRYAQATGPTPANRSLEEIREFDAWLKNPAGTPFPAYVAEEEAFINDLNSRKDALGAAEKLVTNDIGKAAGEAAEVATDAAKAAPKGVWAAASHLLGKFTKRAPVAGAAVALATAETGSRQALAAVDATASGMAATGIGAPAAAVLAAGSEVGNMAMDAASAIGYGDGVTDGSIIGASIATAAAVGDALGPKPMTFSPEQQQFSDYFDRLPATAPEGASQELKDLIALKSDIMLTDAALTANKSVAITLGSNVAAQRTTLENDLTAKQDAYTAKYEQLAAQGTLPEVDGTSKTAAVEQPEMIGELSSPTVAMDQQQQRTTSAARG